MGHFTHEHEHEHNGVIHSHPHIHDHGHETGHDQSHVSPDDQAVAVLRYMLDHNVHHTAELSDIADATTGEVRHQLLHAVEAFEQANTFLAAALGHL